MTTSKYYTAFAFLSCIIACSTCGDPATKPSTMPQQANIIYQKIIDDKHKLYFTLDPVDEVTAKAAFPSYLKDDDVVLEGGLYLLDGDSKVKLWSCVDHTTRNHSPDHEYKILDVAYFGKKSFCMIMLRWVEVAVVLSNSDKSKPPSYKDISYNYPRAVDIKDQTYVDEGKIVLTPMYNGVEIDLVDKMAPEPALKIRYQLEWKDGKLTSERIK